MNYPDNYIYNKTITGLSNRNRATELYTHTGIHGYVNLTGNVAIEAGNVLYAASTGLALWKTLSKGVGGSESFNLPGNTTVVSTTVTVTSFTPSNAYITASLFNNADPSANQIVTSVSNRTSNTFDLNVCSINSSSNTVDVAWIAIVNEP